jgi:cutinase-like protein
VTSCLGFVRVSPRARRYFVLIAASVFAAACVLAAPAAVANAAQCPDAEVVFARGRVEPPGTGRVGQAFVNALRSKASGKNIGLYAVKYPADTEVDEGANDMSGHIQYMAANCPATRLVLGGYSLGAAVTTLTLAMPSAFFDFTNPMPLGMDQHVAAVALFGNGTQRFLGPLASFNPLYGDRTIELCHAADPVCSDNDADKWADHSQSAYINSGMINQAADYVVGRL